MSTILLCCKLVYEGGRGVENLLILVWKSDIASQFYAPVGFQLDSITTLTTYRDFTRVIHKACGQFFGLFDLFHLVVIWIYRNMYIWQTPSPDPFHVHMVYEYPPSNKSYNIRVSTKRTTKKKVMTHKTSRLHASSIFHMSVFTSVYGGIHKLR